MAKEIRERIFYFFLDDYSTPLVSESIQSIVNAVAFRRSPDVIFKIATESVESIKYKGLNSKTLEQDDDFIIVDSGSYVLNQTVSKNHQTLSMILQPRIERDDNLKGKKLELADIVGRNNMSNNALAEKIRGEAGKTKIEYWGNDFFIRLWSSNTRELIELFARLLAAGSASPGDLESGEAYVQKKDQNQLFRDAGSRYLDLLSSAMDPTTEKLYQQSTSDVGYGQNLREIADSFNEIAKYELLHKNSKNQAAITVKQARRIEITDRAAKVPDNILPVYKGLMRYGLFIRDIRGRSVRGKSSPRWFLRSILIPFYTLSFSKRDSISMSWEQFCRFLEDPKSFAAEWCKKPDPSAPKQGKLSL